MPLPKEHLYTIEDIYNLPDDMKKINQKVKDLYVFL